MNQKMKVLNGEHLQVTCGGRLKSSAMAIAVVASLSGCAVMTPSWLDAKKVAAVDQESQPLMAKRVADEAAKFDAIQADLRKKLETVRAQAVKPAQPVFNPLDAVNVSLKVDDGDVRNVLKAVADQARLNLILPDSLSEHPRKISLTLRNLPASQVFEHVLKSLDMFGSVDRGMMVVTDYQERVYDLDFLQTTTTADFDAGGDVFGANQAASAGQSGGAGGASSGGGGGGGSTGIRNAFNLRGHNNNSMDPYQQIENLLKTIVNPDAVMTLEKKDDKLTPVPLVSQAAANSKGPRFVVNKSTGTMWIRARPSQVEAVSRLVEHYKGVMGRQILIEAQILDIQLNDQFQYGVDWNMLKGNAAVAYGASAMTLGQISSQTIGGANPGYSVTIPSQTIGTTGTPQLSGSWTRGANNYALNLLKTFGAVHVLSNPSLRVKNTQPAVVSVGSNSRYIQQTTSNVSNSGGGQSTVSSNVVTGNLFDGVMLGVIPFISEDGTVNLTINPVQTLVEPGSTALVDVGSPASPLKISLPVVDFKGITTSLSLHDGDTVILGGLISESGNRSKTGIPVVAEIPILGELAGTQTRQSNSRELVVVLKVHVL